MWPRLLFLYCAALVAFCLCQETPLRPLHQESQRSSTRPRRQVALFQLPRLLFTFFRVLRETRNDTNSAIRQISQILNDNIRDAPSTEQPPSQSTPPGEGGDNMTTTTEYVLTRQELLRIARLNIRGLVRLFNQEVDIAVNDSYRNVAQTRAEFRESLRQALRPATTTTTTTTTQRTTTSDSNEV
ncbi:uncharacterized protein LOC124605845 [Schistocerca americana]|uniref:uncharacterized protein LOC124605845 n=1 Tax=Schistocerca americana TaxID=7009 RepID=UPI001F502790|nr:uncharacterized protein LOC124605845 [Schistocerca americana]XP_046993733.1 uncharacterized protein LOC124605845 [Schistocerca americana]XP_046993734.1 uncharacterized protein LOC124605845 [Schistocerca americana]